MLLVLLNIVMLLTCSSCVRCQGWLRVRAPGELIHDNLFGQNQFKMILLPPCVIGVVAAASAVVWTLCGKQRPRGAPMDSCVCVAWY